VIGIRAQRLAVRLDRLGELLCAGGGERCVPTVVGRVGSKPRVRGLGGGAKVREAARHEPRAGFGVCAALRLFEQCGTAIEREAARIETAARSRAVVRRHGVRVTTFRIRAVSIAHVGVG
jgi:hypothetical protein